MVWEGLGTKGDRRPDRTEGAFEKILAGRKDRDAKFLRGEGPSLHGGLDIISGLATPGGATALKGEREGRNSPRSFR